MTFGVMGARSLVRLYNARSYVQDGLIAMWDGEENAGWGVHDANATVWKDLVGTLDLSIYHGTPVINNNNVYLLDSSLKSAASVPLSSADGGTVEVVNRTVAFHGYYNNRWDAIFSLDLGGTPQFTTNGWGYRNRAYPTGLSPDVSTRISDGGIYTDSFANGKIYSNAVLRQTRDWKVSPNMVYVGFTQSNGVSYSGDTEFYSIRMYSRTLTDAEIAHNCAVDKVRFGVR